MFYFQVLELDLPVINGVCTLDGGDGYGTPLTCEQQWNGDYKTYYFTNNDAPTIISTNGQPYHRVIASISETATELKGGKGLASRGSLSLRLIDFIGDPNKESQALQNNPNIAFQGTFFGKMFARQVLQNKKVRLKTYKSYLNATDLGAYDSTQLVSERYYVVESMENQGGGFWALNCKDELSFLDKNEIVYPETTGGYLRQDIDTLTTSIPVDPNVDYQSVLSASTNGYFIVRIGNELMKVTGVSGNLTSNATLTVSTRGQDILGTTGNLLSKTEVDDHSGGDEVFICDISDNERVDDFIYRVLEKIGFDVNTYVNKQDWASEVDVWLTNVHINTIYTKSDDVWKVINKVLSNFMVDMWFDQDDRNVKLKAISGWKNTDAKLYEGNQINAGTLRISNAEGLRATRAIAIYDKSFKVKSDDIENYKKSYQFTATNLISEALYVKNKDLVFEPSPLLDDNSAELLTKRTVNRFGFKPQFFSWVTQPQKLSFKTGDIVSIISKDIQDYNGNYLTQNKRAQIVKVEPQYKKDGISYNIKALTYQVEIQSGTEFVVTNIDSSKTLNLHTFVESPTDPVELTIVFDGLIGGSDDVSRPTVTAGNFPQGSKLNIILANGAFLSAKGGDGGRGGSLWVKPTTKNIYSAGNGEDGQDGGIVFDCNGIDCDFYLSGTTPSQNYPLANGYIYAPSGGDGGWVANYIYESESDSLIDSDSGRGGNGGAGYLAGNGGLAGEATGAAFEGITGADGTSDRSQKAKFGINGVDGQNPSSLSATPGNGGLAGKGIVNNGATVTINIDPNDILTDRYIKGLGDN
jgi:hypothetical protein